MNTLHEIGLKYNTDKAWYHEFTKVYDKVLDSFREKEINFLEIGILDGKSLLMWHEYFKLAKIYGADIFNKSFLNNERISTFIANQEIKEDLEKLPKDLDVILDDGGHTMLQQQLSFNILFKNNLKDGGIYILEDLHTSEPFYYKTHGSNANNNTLNFLEDLKTGIYRKTSTYYVSEYDFDILKQHIEYIEIIKVKEDSITSIIKKKQL